ncbi:hypothetical protein WN944_004184 [Citrus x changshan-huyou]|uniref:non-specific serine/threonine protein kinase n=1 Tax=Citrus x changshan-huyou TaxID=2935761 RepID=A0AAP0LZW8_9ROSI
MNTSPVIALLFFFLFIILSFLFHFSFSHCANLGTETDKQALLAFKSKVADPFGALSTWNDSVNFCLWLGVTCNLKHQRVISLNLSGQNPTGTLSPYIGNLTFLRLINLQQNSFLGMIPHEIGRLILLRSIIFNRNMLQGEKILDLVVNKLEGKIPSELGSLFKLKGLGLANNYLTWPVPQSLSNLSFLQQLSLSENNLNGNIPVELGQLKHLNMFQVSVNSLTRSIPVQLFNITSMEYFAVSENHLLGEIPPYIGFTLLNIRILLLAGNQFFGNIPHSISNASKLEWLHFANNSLTGSIPEDLGRLRNLTRLNFARNNLGTRKELDLHRNSIRGSLPSALGTCHQLQKLDLSDNNLSGAIPSEVIGLSSLSGWLDLSHNHFTGRIPSEVGNLKNIRQLDLSENKLSGKMPKFLDTFPFLRRLNLSFNNLEGEVPHKGIFKNSSAISVAGNGKLCGGVSELKLPPCTSSESKKSEKSKGLKFMIPLLSRLVGLVLVMSLLIINRLRKKRTVTGSESSSRKDLLLNVSYESLLKATGGFSSANLVGAGSFGSVYKGILDPDQTDVAVKVLFLHQRGALKSFMAECEVLRNIRHKYLHRHCGKPIVHCDLKPSNILLDNDMTAHVGDFGLTRFIPEAIRSNQSSSIGLKGTVGYAPPEYGMGSRVSTYGDVYSYGILLLETFTGKRPTSDIFAEGLDLHNFVKNALPEQISEVLDPLFVTGGEEGEGTAEEKLKQDQVQESLATILKIGVACSVESPRERMDISDVVNNLQKVKSTLLRCGIN